MRPSPIFTISAIGMLFSSLLLAGCNGGDGSSETPQTFDDRPWLMEAEFGQDASLHATPDQVIVFDLEPAADSVGSAASGLIRNTVSLLVRETDTSMLSFCIPEEEPYIMALELETDAGETVMRVEPGGDCSDLDLPAGRYRMHVFHDGMAVDPSGMKAFLHRPDRARLLGGGENAFAAPDFMAFLYGGKFVTDATAPPLLALMPTAATVDANAVWKLSNTGSNRYSLQDGNNMSVKVQSSSCAAMGSLFTGSNGDVTKVPTFTMADNGNWNFSMMGYQIICWDSAGVFVNLPPPTPANTLGYYDNGNKGNSFNARYKGFNCESCDADGLPLQEGEVALFAGCNYAGPAIVFRTDVPDFSIYNAAASQGLAMGNDMVASVRVGPDTLAILYDESQYDGSPVTIGEDIPCLDGTIQGSATVSSMQIMDMNIQQLIISTNTCENCILTGINLSGLDLTAGTFSGTDFSEANLTETIFRSARLDHATFFGSATMLAGTDFANAILFCTDLSGTDLSTATFDENPIITKDFTCRLDLSGATLPIDALPFASWRYLDLTGATLLNGTGATISTLEAPLDLSGALLSGVIGLSGAAGSPGVVLDGADLGCATPEAADKNCTYLMDIDLSHASLMKANLAVAFLNGANLSFTNLTEANLQEAQLLKSPTTQTSANLDGAFLKNANLAGADLSGVNMTNANWYSTTDGVCPGNTWKGTCASGQGATLSNANLQGAYLNGLDLSDDATLQGVNLGEALLVGVNFTGANLSRDPTTGAATTFDRAFLQGADFTDADTTGTDFSSAYVDLSSGGILLFQLPDANLEFEGYAPSAGSIQGCVEFTYSAMTTLPTTTSSNICPDGTSGSCSTAVWQSPITPISSALPPSTSDPTTGLPNGCSTATMDINWILQ